MSPTTIHLDDEVYEKLAAHRRDGESYSETVERLLDGPSLLDLAGTLSDEEAEAARGALAELDARDETAVDDLVREFE